MKCIILVKILKEKAINHSVVKPINLGGAKSLRKSGCTNYKMLAQLLGAEVCEK